MRWGETGWRHREPSAEGWLAAAGIVDGRPSSRGAQGLRWVGREERRDRGSDQHPTTASPGSYLNAPVAVLLPGVGMVVTKHPWD
jgi:hypothetical protein